MSGSEQFRRRDCYELCLKRLLECFWSFLSLYDSEAFPLELESGHRRTGEDGKAGAWDAGWVIESYRNGY